MYVCHCLNNCAAMPHNQYCFRDDLERIFCRLNLKKVCYVMLQCWIKLKNSIRIFFLFVRLAEHLEFPHSFRWIFHVIFCFAKKRKEITSQSYGFSIRFSYFLFLFSSPLSFTKFLLPPFVFRKCTKGGKKLKANFPYAAGSLEINCSGFWQKTFPILFLHFELVGLLQIFRFFSLFFSSNDNHFSFYIWEDFSFHPSENRELCVHALERLNENWKILALVFLSWKMISADFLFVLCFRAKMFIISFSRCGEQHVIFMRLVSTLMTLIKIINRGIKAVFILK